ncbi:MAG TPA: flagellar motor switch protein FliG [Acidimicrobiales bacterium]|nr:flagellar motor switch protein FliG [Acidimicrobiales bacterium]
MPTLTGSQKAAVVLAQLDSSRAAKVLRVMSEQEVVDLMSTLATLPTLAVDEVRGVLNEFTTHATATVQVGQGGVDVARKLLRERLGSAKTEEVLDRFVQASYSHPLSFLHRIDPQQIASFVGNEHPQLVALVLSHLPADSAANVIAKLEESTRSEVARRIATMGRISPDVVQQVAEFLEQKLAAVLRTGVTTANETGGVASIVAILNQTERASEQQILAELEQSDPELAEQIRNEMFVFDDIANLDDRTLQRILRNVVPKDLATALKTVPDGFRDKFLRNLSERAAQDVLEEVDLLGPTRVSQVETAQSAIVKIVRELEASGEIVLARGDDEFV